MNDIELRNFLNSMESTRFPGQYTFEKDGGYYCDIGTGGYGKVYKALKGSERKAVKILGLNDELSTLDLERLEREAGTQQRVWEVCPDHVVRIEDHRYFFAGTDREGYIEGGRIYSTEPPDVACRLFYFIFMERLEQVCRGTRFLGTGFDSLTETRILEFAAQIGAAIEAASSLDPPVIHRDIKLDNVFYDRERGLYKLGDFGLAKFLRNTKSNTIAGGSEGYAAPEIFYGCEFVDERSDVYSFGILLYLLLNNKIFPGSNEPGRPCLGVQYSSDAIIRQPLKGSRQFKDLVMRAISFYPEERPYIGEMNERIAALLKARVAEDVVRAQKALTAEGADMARNALTTGGADMAQKALTAEGADMAQKALTAEGADMAQKALTAEGVDMAQKPLTAEGADMAQEVPIAGGSAGIQDTRYGMSEDPVPDGVQPNGCGNTANGNNEDDFDPPSEIGIKQGGSGLPEGQRWDQAGSINGDPPTKTRAAHTERNNRRARTGGNDSRTPRENSSLPGQPGGHEEAGGAEASSAAAWKEGINKETPGTEGAMEGHEDGRPSDAVMALYPKTRTERATGLVGCVGLTLLSFMIQLRLGVSVINGSEGRVFYAAIAAGLAGALLCLKYGSRHAAPRVLLSLCGLILWIAGRNLMAGIICIAGLFSLGTAWGPGMAACLYALINVLIGKSAVDTGVLCSAVSGIPMWVLLPLWASMANYAVSTGDYKAGTSESDRELRYESLMVFCIVLFVLVGVVASLFNLVSGAKVLSEFCLVRSGLAGFVLLVLMIAAAEKIICR